MMHDAPHQGVFVRLGLSDLHGIGVFAIRTIEEGTNIFENDRVELVWITKTELERSEPSEAARRLYHDFGIDAGDSIGCPVNFHNLTPGWYLNRPAVNGAANIRVNKDLNFFASRTIAVGEELTVDYAELNDAGRAYRAKTR